VSTACVLGVITMGYHRIYDPHLRRVPDRMRQVWE
jgi:hypothetical protein